MAEQKQLRDHVHALAQELANLTGTGVGNHANFHRYGEICIELNERQGVSNVEACTNSQLIERAEILLGWIEEKR